MKMSPIPLVWLGFRTAADWIGRPSEGTWLEEGTGRVVGLNNNSLVRQVPHVDVETLLEDK